MANDMQEVVKATLTQKISEANDIATKVAAASVDSKSLVHEIRDNDESVTDTTVLDFRTKYNAAVAELESWVAEINTYITATLLPAQSGEVDVEALKAEYKDLKSKISAARTFAKTMGMEDSDLADLPELKTLRGGTSSGGKPGGKRPRIASISVGNVDGSNMVRVYDTVENKDGTTVEVNNFTLAARFIGNKDHANTKVEVSDLQRAAFEAAKTDDLSTLNGTPFEFVYSPDEGKHSYNVKVTPKDNNAAETAPVVAGQPVVETPATA